MNDSTQGASPKSHRFFYRDRMEAAWMAKRFRAVITTTPDGDDLISASELARPLLRRVEMKYYVHPRSVYLFRARKGDVILWTVNCRTKRVQIVRRSFTVEKAQATITRRNGRIIQRGGNVFHWPESEAV